MIHSKFIEFDEALPILLHPDIFNRIKEDNVEPEDLKPNSGEFFIGIFKDDVLVAVWWLISVSGTTLEVHAQVLRCFRKHKFIAWGHCLYLIIEQLPDIHKLQAKIPTCFSSVYLFSKNIGMKDEGVERQSKLINKEYFDQYCIGATIEELRSHYERCLEKS